MPPDSGRPKRRRSTASLSFDRSPILRLVLGSPFPRGTRPLPPVRDPRHSAKVRFGAVFLIINSPAPQPGARARASASRIGPVLVKSHGANGEAGLRDGCANLPTLATPSSPCLEALLRPALADTWVSGRGRLGGLKAEDPFEDHLGSGMCNSSLPQQLRRRRVVRDHPRSSIADCFERAVSPDPRAGTRARAGPCAHDSSTGSPQGRAA